MRLGSTTAVVAALTLVLSATPGHAEAARKVAPAARAPARRQGVILAGRGQVRPARNGPWTSIHEGSVLPDRGEVRSLDEPLRLELARGATVELAPGTTLVMAGQLELQLPGAGMINPARLDLERGEITVTTPPVTAPRDRKTVLVQGEGGLVAICLDGAMLVREMGSRRGDPEGGLAVATTRGEVEFESRGGFRALPEGQVVALRDGRPTALPHPIIGSPTWHHETGLESTGPLAVVTDKDAGAALTLRLTPIDGAASYEVEVARDEAFSTPVWRTKLPGTTTTITTPPLLPGRYFARLRARGVEGLPGGRSLTRALRVALATLPPGGAARGGGFELPGDHALRWDDPADLEVAVGRSGFIRASPELGLVHHEPTSALVRILGERGFVPLLLLPSPVHAEITLGPRLAVWPTNPIEVEVRLVSSSRQPSVDGAAGFDPRLLVMVNLDEVPVRWRREGNLFRATVNHPAGSAGPWVVRVEARDPQNNPIGRNFLEVIAQR
jgi:hypothetical protein